MEHPWFVESMEAEQGHARAAEREAAVAFNDRTGADAAAAHAHAAASARFGRCVGGKGEGIERSVLKVGEAYPLKTQTPNAHLKLTR